MSFERLGIAPFVFLIFVILIYLFLRHEKRFFQWVRLYWDLKPKRFRYIRVTLYGLGLLCLGLSLLDFRGPEEKIEGQIPDQKTIIIIDSSASMLAEDVKPNRFQKAVFLARHFIKNAIGHQIAIVLFSDIQKRLVPFTDDLDLLDARVDGLTETNLQNGGSNISQAIEESLGYLKEQKDGKVQATGNILVLTDSEDHSSFDSINIPDSVALAIVGIGTAKGAKIPLRTRNGVFRGYKRFNGQEIVTKLDEEWMKRLEGRVENYRYWISNSFSLPTQEIIAFFRTKFLTKFNKGAIRVRPVLAEYLVIPGVILLSLSFLCYLPNQWILSSLILVALFPYQLRAQQAPELPPLSPETLELLEKHKHGALSKLESIALASQLLKAKRKDQAATLFKENEGVLKEQSKSNYAVALAQVGRIDQALELLKEAQKETTDPEILEKIAQNTLLVFQEQKKQQQQQQDKKKKEKKEKKQNQGDKQKQKSQNKQSDQKEKSSKSGSESQENKEEGKQKDKNQQKSKADKSEKQNKKKNEQKGQEKAKTQAQSLKQKEEEIKLKRKLKKIPGFVKQILDDDRNLQKQYLDTREKMKGDSKKDW